MVITRRATDEIRDIEHHGNVIAARSWGAELEELRVPPAPPGTHESLLHSNAIRRCSSSLTTVFPDETRPLQPLAVLPRMDGMAETDPGGR